MSTDSRETRRREAPIGVNSYKINGVQRVSPAWRKRSKSTSQDNALYRMGVRKNAQGEWADVINRVPPAMIIAMRKLRLNSIKREPTADVDVGVGLLDGDLLNIGITGVVEVMEDVGESELDMAHSNPGIGRDDADGEDLDMPDSPGAHEDEDDNDDEDYGDGDERAIDMTDSTAVYGRIRIYLDVERKVAGGHAYVDSSGLKVETVMISVEENAMDMVEEKRVPGSDDKRSDAGRDSLASVIEEDEERVDVDSVSGPERQQSSTYLVGDATNRPTKKRRIEWTDEEIRYVGAWSDAGFARGAIIELFRTRFPDKGFITKSTISTIRRCCLNDIVHLQKSTKLGQELGLVTGKWQEMTAKLFGHQQTFLMAQHKLELHQGNELLLASLNEQARLEAHSAIRQILVTQRMQTRDLRRQQSIQLRRHNLIAEVYRHYLAQLTILIHQSKMNIAAYQEITEPYVLPIEFEHRLHEKIGPVTSVLRTHIYEYDVAMSLLEEQHGMSAELDYHHEAMELLDFDEFVRDHVGYYWEVERRSKTFHSRRTLYIQQDERRTLFEERQKKGLLGENEAKPLEASEVLALLRGGFFEDEVIDALLTSDEGEKERIEASLRAIRPGFGFWRISNALNRVWPRHCARKEEAEVVTKLLQGVRDTQLKQLYEQLHQQQTSRKFLFEQQEEEDAKSNVVSLQTRYPGPLETSKIVDLISETLAEWRWLSALLEEDEMDKQRLESSLRKVIELPLGKRPTLWTRRS